MNTGKRFLADIAMIFFRAAIAAIMISASARIVIEKLSLKITISYLESLCFVMTILTIHILLNSCTELDKSETIKIHINKKEDVGDIYE